MPGPSRLIGRQQRRFAMELEHLAMTEVRRCRSGNPTSARHSANRSWHLRVDVVSLERTPGVIIGTAHYSDTQFLRISFGA